jgi:hypothetical protein
VQSQSHDSYSDALNDFTNRVHSVLEEMERNTEKKLKDRIGSYGNVV